MEKIGLVIARRVQVDIVLLKKFTAVFAKQCNGGVMVPVIPQAVIAVTLASVDAGVLGCIK